MQSVTIGKNQAGQRLDKFLHKYLPNAGSGFLYKMLRKKNITLNGKKAEGSERLEEGDWVDIFFSQETFEKFAGRPAFTGKQASVGRPESAGKQASAERPASAETHAESCKDSSGIYIHPAETPEKQRKNQKPQDGSDRKNFSGDQGSPDRKNPTGRRNYATAEYEKAYGLLKGIQVLYEDDNFLFLNKPVGILTQKAKPQDCSLNEWMIGYLLQGDAKLAEELYMFRPSVCNRLDRNTSGIVLCGKSLAGLQFLGRYIRERSLRKFYHTICVGELREPARIQGYLCKDGNTNKVSVSGQGKIDRENDYIETAYVPLSVKRGYTYLEVELITGKPHQIRAHMASMGHHLIGDFKYGKEEDNRRMKREFGLQHQLLHACRIVFPKITSGVGIVLSGRTFTAPEPELFLTIKAALEL